MKTSVSMQRKTVCLFACRLVTVPKYLIDAYVATEDHRFWNHPGVDWIRTIRAALNYFLGNSFGGASTITQQVVKNITQDDDVTIQRKVQEEILRALNLEKAKGQDGNHGAVSESCLLLARMLRGSVGCICVFREGRERAYSA